MRSLKNIFFTFLITVICLMLVLGCNKKEEFIDLGDGGLLSGQPCSAPSFQNISPGVTTKEQAMKIFENIGIQEDCEYFDSSEEGGIRGVTCKNIGINLNQQNVVLTVFYVPVKKIIISDVIYKFGEPNCIYTSGSGVENKEPYFMRLYFDNSNVVVYMPDQYGDGYFIDENTRILEFAYETIEEFEAEKPGCKPWEGYGKY